MNTMTKNIRPRGLTAAALAVAALFAAQPAAADIIELNNFWAGSGNVTIDFTGVNWHDGSTVTGLHESGGSGGFKTYDLTTDPTRQNAFESWCVDIFDNFSFIIDATDILKPANVALAGSTATLATVFSSKAATDLGRLYTDHHADIDSTSSSANNEAAFQLAVWEIVNDRSGTYSLTSGDFRATGTGSATANTWLSELSVASTSLYTADIWTVQSARPEGFGAQDVAVFRRVPEPATYALVLTGLGLLGFTSRRKKQNLG